MDKLVVEVDSLVHEQDLRPLLEFISPTESWFLLGTATIFYIKLLTHPDPESIDVVIKEAYVVRAHRILSIFQEQFIENVVKEINWEILAVLISLSGIENGLVRNLSEFLSTSILSAVPRQKFLLYLLEKYQMNLFHREERLTDQGRPVAFELPPDKFHSDQSKALLEPKWKTKNYLISHLIFWIIDQQSSSSIEVCWHRIIPSVLRILNDLSPNIKLQGIELVNRLLKITEREFLLYTGILKILKDDLLVFYTFIPPRFTIQTSVTLINASFTTLVSLYPEENENLNSIMLNGINSVFQFAFDYPLILQAAFSQIMVLTEKMNVSYLPYLTVII